MPPARATVRAGGVAAGSRGTDERRRAQVAVHLVAQREDLWMMAEIDGDFVVLLIGARFNSFHLLQSFRDLGGRRGMKHMLDYLTAHPEKGLLGYQMGLPTIVAVLAVIRLPRGFRQRRQRPAHGRVAQLLEARGHEHPHRHLARDLPGPGGRVRGDLREHDTVRAGQGGPAGPVAEGKTARERFRAAASGVPGKAG